MLNKNQKKVIVGLSGGVDSSVSAWLLQQQGYMVEGLFMKNWEEDDNDQYCTVANDLVDTQMICDYLGIKLHTVNFAAEYWDNVFVKIIDEYQSLRTPNPDILCNKEIKFKIFLDFATEDLGADFIATGHYVRRSYLNNKSRLLKGIDSNKDQSYFLYTLDYKQLLRCLFPLGELIKTEVRNIASKLRLVTANKKDSTGICFIGKRNFRKFIERYLPLAQQGTIISVEGNKVGYHKGLMYYTIGQRKGLGIGGTSKVNKYPWYVVDKDIKNNNLIVAQGNKHPRLMSTSFVTNHLYWIDREPIREKIYCTVKTRYRQPDINCIVNPISSDSLDVILEQPIAAVTPGQSAVFYLDNRCLGGGIIESNKLIS